MQHASQMILPNGQRFRTWDRAGQFKHTYHVAGDAANASDDNPGTVDAPFKSIQRAAAVVQPSERVLIRGGVYRECVRPTTGGTAPEAMVSFQAMPGERVVVSASEVYEGPWQRSTGIRAGWSNPQQLRPNTDAAPCWAMTLPGAWFDVYNPFGMLNLPGHHLDGMQEVFNFPAEQRVPLLLKRGLVFQDGRRLKQVPRFIELAREPGSYWVENSGRVVHVRPFDDAPPEQCGWEFSAREQCFAPETRYLSYIHVDGLTFEHAAGAFPVPQRAAVSANWGDHWIIENCTIRHVNALGIDLGHQGFNADSRPGRGYHIVRRNHVDDCGICGICGTAGTMHDLLIEDNLITRTGWHGVERLWENAGIKLHHVHDSLVRRNLVKSTTAASGIWLDAGIANSRVTQNVVLDIESGFGGIFMEISRAPNWVDQNIIAQVRALVVTAAAGDTKVTGGAGIYEHDLDHLRVMHNLIVQTAGPAARLRLGQPRRLNAGRGSTCFDNHVLNNVFIDCGGAIEYGRTNGNLSDGNVVAQCGLAGFKLQEPEEHLDMTGWRQIHGWEKQGREIAIDAKLDLEDMTLTLSAAERLPTVTSSPTLTTDFDGEPRTLDSIRPGPLADWDGRTRTVNLDPRQLEPDRGLATTPEPVEVGPGEAE